MDKIIVTTKEELQTLIEGSVRLALQQNKDHSSGNQFDAQSLLSLDEAAKFLKLARQTIYGFTSKRTIPFLKRGKKLYFRKEALEKWLSEGAKKTIKQMQEEIGRTGTLKIS